MQRAQYVLRRALEPDERYAISPPPLNSFTSLELDRSAMVISYQRRYTQERSGHKHYLRLGRSRPAGAAAGMGSSAAQ
jgi:hypothetical protein